MSDTDTELQTAEITEGEILTAVGETAKKPWQSKTIIFGVLSLLAALVPGLGDWVTANPQLALGIIGAVLLVVRRYAGGPIDFGRGTPGGGTLLMICMAAGCALAGAVLSSCSHLPGSGVPVSIGIETDDGSYHYSSKSGLTGTIRINSGK